jgi:tight adherence protein B
MDVKKMIYIAVTMIFLMFFIIITFLMFRVFYKERIIEKLKYYDDNYVNYDKLKKNKRNIGLFKMLSNLIPDFKFNMKLNKKIEIELIKADIQITVKELMAIKLLAATVCGFLAYSIFRSTLIITIVFVLIYNIPKRIIRQKKQERIKSFDSQLNEGIMIISNSLKAGYSFLQAVEVVSEETKDPFSKEFKKLLKEMSLGISEEEALKNLLVRMESQDLRLIINAILIQKDIGGNLSEILDNISETIRERQKIKNEIKTLTAQGRLSGIIVMLIPVFLCGIIFLFNKEYMILMFTNQIGIIMLGLAVMNETLGFFIIKRIINIDM